MPILTDSVNVLLWVGFGNGQLVLRKTALPEFSKYLLQNTKGCAVIINE